MYGTSNTSAADGVGIVDEGGAGIVNVEGYGGEFVHWLLPVDLERHGSREVYSRADLRTVLRARVAWPTLSGYRRGAEKFKREVPTHVPTIVHVNDHKPRTVYIDINHWYALGRADAGKPDTPQDAVVSSKLQGEVDAGRLVIPLSSVTYTELTENPRDRQRKPTADAMLKLSRLATIAPVRKIVDEELARELNRRFGRPAFPVKVPKIGHGAGFAFGVPGHLTATGFTDAERDRIEAQMGKTIADLEVEVNAYFEYWLLATPRSLRNRIPGFEPVSTRKDAEAELAEIKVMVANLHGSKEIAGRPMDAIAARQYIRDIFDNFKRALLGAGFTTRFPFRDKQELTSFLEHLPTQRVATSLKYNYVKQTSTKWKINHLRDIEALSVAIPYTDAVVTDADVANAATRGARLDAEFGTPVFKNLTELVEHLGL